MLRGFNPTAVEYSKLTLVPSNGMRNFINLLLFCEPEDNLRLMVISLRSIAPRILFGLTDKIKLQLLPD